MTSFNLSGLKDQLTEVQNSSNAGVSFSKKSLKLDSEEDALEVVKAIHECANLEYLDLEGNTLGPHAAKAVAEALEEKGSSLKRALWKDMFTGRLKTEIPKAIEYLGTALCSAGTHLIELDLSDNAFGPIGIKGLANFLTSSSCYTLRELKLNNNGLGISGGKILAKALLDCYDNSSKAGSCLALKVFVAGRNRLENEGAKALASVFQKLTSLEEVVMPQNSIYYAGITALANGLSANRKLRVLNLNDNTVGPKGAQALAKVLPNFRNLEQLNLGDCLLKTKGSVILADALVIKGNHPLLAEVNLSYNEIHAKGANPIANAMADKVELITLQLDGNAFGSEGRDILRKVLTESNRIDSLSTLSDNYSEDESEEDHDAEDEEEDKVEDSECEVDESEDHDAEDEEEDKVEDSECENESKENEVVIENNGNKTPDNIALPEVTVAQFLKSPTGKMLLLLQGDIVQDCIDYAKDLSKNSDTSPELKFIEEFTKIIMKVSANCTSVYFDWKMIKFRFGIMLY
ncbi:ran GTPase activating protein isoform X2 [Ptiloglossa arizonensis]|uniref:ran GTPase activating protein isoform X2 n=1 Tax=Ptiloglossa arizonensis TaxID=3350558 RepID=UPI003F9FF846